MIFLKIIGIIAYFLLPLIFVMWLCYEKIDIYKYGVRIDPAFIVWGMILLEFAFFCQILYWLGYLNAA